MYWHMPLENYSVMIKYVDIGNLGDSFMEDLLLLGYENCNWNHSTHKNTDLAWCNPNSFESESGHSRGKLDS